MIVLWGGSSSSRIDQIQITQNKIVRNLFSSKFPHLSTNLLFDHMKLLKVRDIYRLELGKLMFSAINLEKYKKFKDLVDNLNWTHNFATRRMNDYRLPNVRVNVNKGGALFSAVSLWNELSNEVKSSTSLSQFKRFITKWMK